MEPRTAPQPPLLPKGVADPDGRTGYFAVDTGGIDAVDLADGSLLWHTGTASRPLYVSGERLIAQRPEPGKPNASRIVLLDLARHGEPVLTSDPVVLPDWVEARSWDPETFRVQARIEGGALVLDWEARSRYTGGAAPSREVLREAQRSAGGTVRVDLETGEVGGQAAEARRAPMRSAELREAVSPPVSPEIVWQTEPWTAGDRQASLAMEESGDAMSLLLETQGSGASRGAGERMELARGAALVPSLSPDGRYVLVEPDEPDEKNEGRKPWWIFDASTGQRVATVPHEEGATEPCVVGPRLIYLVQEPPLPAPGEKVRKVIKARDLKSGELLWERPLSAVEAARAPRLPQ